MQINIKQILSFCRVQIKFRRKAGFFQSISRIIFILTFKRINYKLNIHLPMKKHDFRLIRMSSSRSDAQP